MLIIPGLAMGWNLFMVIVLQFPELNIVLGGIVHLD